MLHSNPGALSGSHSLCFNPWFEFFSPGFRIPILAQGVLRHFWQLWSRAGRVTAQPSAGSWGSSSAEESEASLLRAPPRPERKQDWGLGRQEHTLDACQGGPGDSFGGCGGWGGRAGEVRAVQPVPPGSAPSIRFQDGAGQRLGLPGLCQEEPEPGPCGP